MSHDRDYHLVSGYPIPDPQFWSAHKGPQGHHGTQTTHEVEHQWLLSLAKYIPSPWCCEIASGAESGPKIWKDQSECNYLHTFQEHFFFSGQW